MDTDIDNVFVKRKRYKKKKGEFDDKLIKEILDKHEGFDELFSDVSRLGDDYRDYEDLFDQRDDVDAMFYGIERYDYFS